MPKFFIEKNPKFDFLDNFEVSLKRFSNVN